MKKTPAPPPAKNPHAVALGRSGGRARRDALSPARRSQIARDAINARWDAVRAATKPKRGRKKAA